MSKLLAIQSSVTALAVLSTVGVVSLAGFRLAKADATNKVYRDRLESIASEYETLRTQYNTAVRETAVTELVVEDRAVSVNIRTIEGQLRTIETDLSADREIYVDFALVGGRLWIRRLFDADTAPSAGVIIDPSLSDIDWDSEQAHLGRAVYRTLSEGRWVVATTGDGSLSLTQIPEDEIITLASPPELGEFDELDAAIDEEIDRITSADIVRSIIGN